MYIYNPFIPQFIYLNLFVFSTSENVLNKFNLVFQLHTQMAAFFLISLFVERFRNINFHGWCYMPFCLLSQLKFKENGMITCLFELISDVKIIIWLFCPRTNMFLKKLRNSLLNFGLSYVFILLYHLSEDATSKRTKNDSFIYKIGIGKIASYSFWCEIFECNKPCLFINCFVSKPHSLLFSAVNTKTESG